MAGVPFGDTLYKRVFVDRTKERSSDDELPPRRTALYDEERPASTEREGRGWVKE